MSEMERDRQQGVARANAYRDPSRRLPTVTPQPSNAYSQGPYGADSARAQSGDMSSNGMRRTTSSVQDQANNVNVYGYPPIFQRSNSGPAGHPAPPTRYDTPGSLSHPYNHGISHLSMVL